MGILDDFQNYWYFRLLWHQNRLTHWLCCRSGSNPTIDPDPDPEKWYGSGGSGSATLPIGIAANNIVECYSQFFLFRKRCLLQYLTVPGVQSLCYCVFLHSSILQKYFSKEEKMNASVFLTVISILNSYQYS